MAQTGLEVSLSEQEASDFMEVMEANAVEQPVIELNPSNWEQQFGIDGKVSTPVGKVKMGDNQIAKLFEKGRSEQFGMIKPTLETPLAVIEVPSEATGQETERASSLLFVKTFIGKNGEKVYYFKSVTVKKDGMEVSISSHYDRPKRIKEALRNGKLLYRFDGGAQTEHRPVDVSVTASHEEEQGFSENKDTEKSRIDNKLAEKIVQERAKVEQNPTEAQKEAGNYRKGHVSLDGYNITIENPKGSVRSGRDANGQEWSVTMNNDYGYIRGTEGVDGDHIDVFLSDDPTQGDVYVIDQVNPDTGEFDEHKVMYGFRSALAAKRAYLANYSPGWKGLGTVTKVSREEFRKWVESSHRKTKPFAEYKSVQKEEDGQGDVLFREVEEANERFNDELDAFKAKTHKGLLHLGQPGRILNACGINMELTLSPTVLSRKLKQHGLNVDDIKGLAGAIQEPILVYQHGDVHPNTVIVTDLTANEGKVSVAVELDGEGNVVELNNISSVHSKDATTELERLSNMRDGYLEQALRWVDKNKVSDWLGIADLNSPIHANNPKLISTANILQNFENPSITEGNLRRGESTLADDVFFRIDGNEAADFAQRHNLNEKDVQDYADYMREGNLNGAARAFHEIRRKLRLDNVGASLGQFAKIFSPIEKELYSKFGDINGLRQKYVQAEMEQRNMMEATRKRAEEAAEAERKRLQTFQDMTDEQLDKEYFKAVEANDEQRMRDLVNEAARRNGYGDVNSEYQGVGAWSAPGNPGYESDEERRAAVENDAPDVNVTDIADGYSQQPVDYFTNLHAYGNNTPHGRESGEAINEAMEEVRNGKDPMVKVYRAVPKTVKEGKSPSCRVPGHLRHGRTDDVGHERERAFDRWGTCRSDCQASVSDAANRLFRRWRRFERIRTECGKTVVGSVCR